MVLALSAWSAERGAVEAMAVVWPAEAALRGEPPNRPEVHWLKTVVLNVEGKGAARLRRELGRSRPPDLLGEPTTSGAHLEVKKATTGFEPV